MPLFRVRYLKIKSLKHGSLCAKMMRYYSTAKHCIHYVCTSKRRGKGGGLTKWMVNTGIQLLYKRWCMVFQQSCAHKREIHVFFLSVPRSEAFVKLMCKSVECPQQDIYSIQTSPQYLTVSNLWATALIGHSIMYVNTEIML